MVKRVTCSEKSKKEQPFFTLKAIGGENRDGSLWKRSIADAIADIESGSETYYVNVNGMTPNLVVATRNGQRYLATRFDRDLPATLLGLPDCPA